MPGEGTGRLAERGAEIPGPSSWAGSAALWRQRSGRLAAFVEAALSVMASLLLAALLGLVLTSVALRYLFSTGLVGAEEAALWLFVFIVAAGMPLALSGPLAMRLDAFVGLLPRPFLAPANLAADAVTVVAALALLDGGTAAAGVMGSASVVLGLPEWLRPAAFAAGGGTLLALLLLRRLAEGKGSLVLLSCLFAALAYALPENLAWAWPPSTAALLLAGVGLLLGAPLAHCLLAAAALAVPFGSSLPEPAVISTAAGGLSKFLLLAIPFFLLAGGLLTASGAAKRLVRLAGSLVGHRPAGLAQTALLTSVLFSGASGSSVANAAFGAGTFYPQLVRHGYRPPRAAAVVAAASVLDNVIPPSIAFLLLAAATDLSVGALLVGGAYAGMVMAACLALAIHFVHRGTATMPAAGWRDRRRALMHALPALGLVVVVVAGIRVGIVTTTEAAALAAGYALLLTVIRAPGRRNLLAVFRQSAGETAAIGLLVAAATPIAFLLAVDGFAAQMADLVTSLGAHPVPVLLLCNIVLLAAGLFLDIGAAILLLAPILVPVAAAAGMDPVAFGVILVVNLMIGGVTPPVGILVYVVGGVTGIAPSTLFRAVLPYLAALLFALLLLCLAALLV